MSTTLQANRGGELHRLSDKFYKGGQFMPEPDRLAGAKRKARKAAEKFVAFTNPEICDYKISGKIPVCVTPVGARNNTAVFWAESTEDAIEVRAILREMIEQRLGGIKIAWE